MNPPEPFITEDIASERETLIVAPIGEPVEEKIYPPKAEKPELTEGEILREYLTEEAKRTVDLTKPFKREPLMNMENKSVNKTD